MQPVGTNYLIPFFSKEKQLISPLSIQEILLFRSVPRKNAIVSDLVLTFITSVFIFEVHKSCKMRVFPKWQVLQQVQSLTHRNTKLKRTTGKSWGFKFLQFYLANLIEFCQCLSLGSVSNGDSLIWEICVGRMCNLLLNLKSHSPLLLGMFVYVFSRDVCKGLVLYCWRVFCWLDDDQSFALSGHESTIPFRHVNSMPQSPIPRHGTTCGWLWPFRKDLGWKSYSIASDTARWLICFLRRIVNAGTWNV